MHRRLDTVIYIVSAVFLIGAASIWWQGVRPDPSLADQGPLDAGWGTSTAEGPAPPGSSRPPEVEEPRVLVVHVGGAVKSPGVYRLREGQRVYEAVMLAEPEDDADLDRLNLAALLKDAQRIIVPKKGEPAPSGGGGDGSESGSTTGSAPGFEFDSGAGVPDGPSFPLNINTASASDLEALPGIGPALASAIIDYRNRYGPFQKAEDLQNVSGIGEKIFARISALIVAE